MEFGMSILLNAPMKDNPDADAYVTHERAEETHEAIGVALNVADLDLAKFSLWRVIREVISPDRRDSSL
jgi:hypothetical protein